MLDIVRVHPRLRQRRAVVSRRRNDKLRTDREALVAVLRRAIGYLEDETDGAPRDHIKMTVALYRWALGELEESLRNDTAELSLIYTVCRLLDNASQELMRAVSVDGQDAASVDWEN